MSAESNILLDEPEKLWTVKSSDGTSMNFTSKLLYPSVTIRMMVEDVGEDMGDVIPLTNISTEILELIKEWLEHHHDSCSSFDPDTADTTDGKDAMCTVINSEWGQEFWSKVCAPIGTPEEEGYSVKGHLTDLMLATNYLDIPYLLHMCAQVMANFIKGKTPDEIRGEFGIEDDFTEEEREQVLRENAWALEE